MDMVGGAAHCMIAAWGCAADAVADEAAGDVSSSSPPHAMEATNTATIAGRSAFQARALTPFIP